MSPTARFDDYVRTVFTLARDRLDHDIRTVIAEHAQAGILESGKTVKRIAQSFEDRAVAAVAACRIAGRRPFGPGHLSTILVTEVDRLSEMTTDALDRLRLLDTAARQLVAKRRDLALAERTPPIEVVKPSPWRRVVDWTVPHAKEIAYVVVGGVLLAIVAARLGLVPIG